ncbi:hypothetical protein HK405_004241, partial [Cladochytrium tenue]
MLAGYSVPAALVADTLHAAGLNLPPAVATPQQARERWFPTLVMLNKADLPGAGERIWHAQDALASGASASSSSSSTLPPPPTVTAAAMPACAAAEAWLQRATARGTIAYVPGDASFRLLPPAAASVTVNSGENNDYHDKDGKDDDESEAEHVVHMLAVLGNTSVLHALLAAILIQLPVVTFPVADLKS